MPQRKHFVTFLSPGALFSPSTTKPIDAWDPVQAVKLVAEITKRNRTRPYGFYFETTIVADPIPDGEGGFLEVEPKEVARSEMFHLDSKVFSFEDIVARNDPSEELLRRNMEFQHAYVCQAMSFKHSSPFNEGDVVVDSTGQITERGNSPERMAYRKVRAKAWEAWEQESARLVREMRDRG